jgi:hypothetical protein
MESLPVTSNVIKAHMTCEAEKVTWKLEPGAHTRDRNIFLAYV